MKSFKAFARAVLAGGGGGVVSVALLLPQVALSQADGTLEEIVVTANKREQNLQDVSSAITALGSDDIDRAGIIDITRLESFVPGLRIGASGGEVRPALRGARTNEVGVAGTGIAEQTVGIFLDGIYAPTTTAGLGAYLDVERIEVLRGPQGTLYGRNTFAGSINVITKAPEMDEFSGELKGLFGDYDRTNMEAVLNIPLGDNLATRLVISSDRHDGLIQNHYLPGTSDDLREKNLLYVRSTTQWDASEDFSATLRIDYSDKDANSEAIWGYQQIYGYMNGEVQAGHIYQMPHQALNPYYGTYQPAYQAHYDENKPAPLGDDPTDAEQTAFDTADDAAKDAAEAVGIAAVNAAFSGVTLTAAPSRLIDDGKTVQVDSGPYDVFRNAVSFDEQEVLSTSLVLNWGLGFADAKLTANYFELEGQQFYDNDYTSGGLDAVGGFGRVDEQKAISVEAQLTSATDGPLEWVGGIYYYDLEADWAWLWRADTDGDYLEDAVVVPGWGNPDDDPHTSTTFSVFGQATLSLGERLRLTGGLRWNDDEKEFTRDGGRAAVTEWSDSAVLHKAVVEFDLTDDSMLYLSSATGIRTGGANDNRVIGRGANIEYDNEEVHSLELGLKNTLLDGAMTLNVVAFWNDYDDVKAQLFAVACNDPDDTRTIAECRADPDVGTITFEYYQNGGGSETVGVEADLRWQATDQLLITATAAFLDAEFDDDYRVGTAQLRPLLGLGNLDGRQDVDAVNCDDSGDTMTGDCTFSFGGWTPALTPDYQIGLNAAYEIPFQNGSTLTPSASVNFVGDYYAFDTNIPEVLVNAHSTFDLRATWVSAEGNIELEAFVLNLSEEEVITRAVVHSQFVGDTPINSVQVNWNNPRTWGLSAKYRF